MPTGQLIFQPPKFDWHIEDQQLAFEGWKGQVILAFEVSNIQQERWYATIVGFLGKEGFKWWNTLPISKNDNDKKDPEAVFKAIADTLEVSTSYWNHIDEIYSDIKQGEHKSTHQLDQHIKDLVERCQYKTEDEKMVHRTELLFHTTKHFEVKKWVRSKKKREDITYQALLQHAMEHEMTVKDFNWHKSKSGIATAATIDEIKTFNFKTGNGYKAKGGSGKTCGRCGCAQHGANIVTSVEIKIILVCVVGPGTEKIPKTETNTDWPIESHKAKGGAGTGIGDMHQRTQRIDPAVDPPPEVPTA